MVGGTDMEITYTITQQNRLIELGVPAEHIARFFLEVKERDRAFKEQEAAFVRIGRSRIKNLLDHKHAPDSWHIQQALESWLMEEEGFTRVSTPTILSANMLDKMTITEENHLREQVFWLDRNKCLRPMLAPNLYMVMKELLRITKEPVRIFETGSCFRKESQGAQHMNEFTMLNFVELAAVAEGQQMDRLEQLARAAMCTLGIENYALVKEASAVYGETLDIEVDGIEIASGSFGPHPLDGNWGIFDSWVGIGFGIERIALVKGGHSTIKRTGKSISFLDGVPLNL